MTGANLSRQVDVGLAVSALTWSFSAFSSSSAADPRSRSGQELWRPLAKTAQLDGGFWETSVAHPTTQRRTPLTIAVVTVLSVPRGVWRDAGSAWLGTCPLLTRRGAAPLLTMARNLMK